MRVLIADDEPNLLKSLSAYFKLESIESVLVPDGLRARSVLLEDTFDAIVLDIRMPGLDGMSLLRWMQGEGFSAPVIMMSAHGDVKDAIEAMHLGAYDYLVKPFDPDELVMRLRKAARERRFDDKRELAKRLPDQEAVKLVGSSPAIAEALRLVDKAGPTLSTVLITGESGTGKELAARLLHEKSGRQGAFVAVNLGAIPDSLVESELFGFEKGAFTGALERKRGLFELADGGTLFLDEIGEMPQSVQVKILRALQERKVQRLGGTKGIPVDARIVAATNRVLEDMVRAGTFREDLYYRVNVVRIHLPPLRQRPGDTLALVDYFCREQAPKIGRRSVRFSREALSALEAYPFPGNVRELLNILERAIILMDGDTVNVSDLQLGSGGVWKGQAAHGGHADAGMAVPASAGQHAPHGYSAHAPHHHGAGTDCIPMFDDAGKPLTIAQIEELAIRAALRRNGGKREQSSVELGITRRTILNKLKEYGAGDL